MNVLPKIDSTNFTWSLWRNGSIHDFNIPCRYHAITEEGNARVLRQYAIGWCDGESVVCRPKKDTRAIMFDHDGVVFWFHLFTKEFKKVFRTK